jgi:hypothetical protein
MLPRTRWLAVAALALAAVALTPGAAADAGPFSTPSEVQNTLDEVASDPWITVERVGTSVEDRSIRVAVATDPTSDVPMEDRVVTFVLTQQHGNEPAGTPAALQLLERIHDRDPVVHNLTNQALVVLPQANPDGAAQGTRENVRDVDLNRDHIALKEPETRAMHAVIDRWDPDIALDHHEYGGTGPGNPVPVRTYDHDLLTLYPIHGNVEEPARSAARSLMYQGIWPEVREEGYSVNEYGEVTVADKPATKIAGGPDPGIQRNHWGLHNIASLLIESRIDLHPNPFHDADRRIDLHRTVVNATVAFAHENADRLRRAPDQAAEQARNHPDERYHEEDPAGTIAEAYRVPADTPVPELASAHGLEEPVLHDGKATLPMDGPLRAHAAAMVHPDSSRAVVEGRPTYAPDDPADAGSDVTPQAAEDAASEGALGAPAAGLPLAVAAAGAAALAIRRRG